MTQNQLLKMANNIKVKINTTKDGSKLLAYKKIYYELISQIWLLHKKIRQVRYDSLNELLDNNSKDNKFNKLIKVDEKNVGVIQSEDDKNSLIVFRGRAFAAKEFFSLYSIGGVGEE